MRPIWSVTRIKPFIVYGHSSPSLMSLSTSLTAPIRKRTIVTIMIVTTIAIIPSPVLPYPSYGSGTSYRDSEGWSDQRGGRRPASGPRGPPQSRPLARTPGTRGCPLEPHASYPSIVGFDRPYVPSGHGSAYPVCADERGIYSPGSLSAPGIRVRRTPSDASLYGNHGDTIQIGHSL